MSSDRLNVRVVSNQNSVELTKNENIVFVTDKKQDTSVNVTQKETTVVTVVSKGPKGDKGDKGDMGNAGTAITNQITTGSITASVNIGTDTFKVQSGSSTFLFVSSSGNVGIGTSVPNAKLHISSNSGYQLRVAASASFSSSLMVSGSFGYVGIGVESPQSILHVNDRPEFNNVTGNVPVTFAGNYQNITTFYNNNNQDNTVLGEPAAWMNIKCDGAEYLIPLYTS